MALIETIIESAATGRLAEIYRRVAGPDGSVANIYKIQSLSPSTLDAHIALYRSLMFGPGPLTLAQRELLGVAVSTTNECHY